MPHDPSHGAKADPDHVSIAVVLVPGGFGIVAGTLAAILSETPWRRIVLADAFVACIVLFPIALTWALSATAGRPRDGGTGEA